MNRIITIKTKIPYKNGKYKCFKFHLVSNEKYDNGQITIRLSSYLTYYLIQLDELFTRYECSSIIYLLYIQFVFIS